MENEKIVQLLEQLNDKATKIIYLLQQMKIQFYVGVSPDSSEEQQLIKDLTEKCVEEVELATRRGVSHRK